MKSYIYIHESHDASVTIFHEGEYYIFEMERITQHKHHHSFGFRHGDFPKEKWLSITDKERKDLSCSNRHHEDEYLSLIYKENTEYYLKLLEMAKTQFGIENDFEMCYHRGMYNNNSHDIYFDKNIINCKQFVRSTTNHHEMHFYGAWIQAPWIDTTGITFDAGGDAEWFKFYDASNGEVRFSNREMFFGFMYNHAAIMIPEIYDNTNRYDQAGKVMGLSAYGRPDKLLTSLFRKSVYSPAVNAGHPYTASKLDSKLREEIETRGEELSSEDIAASAQAAFEYELINFANNYKPMSKDKPVILTGGCALNVPANEVLRRHGYDVYVPPNPNDGGLSHGGLVMELLKQGLIDHREKHNLNFAGPYIEEHFNKNLLRKIYRDRRPIVTDLDEVAEVLKAGLIVGLIQGRSENGPRALGHRSILCDATVPGMKDILNEKVKFREWYRPFAPAVCIENAHQFFDFASEKNMETMSYAVKVREEYKELLSSITHVDGTARVQTVRQEENYLLHQLISKTNGVLLNTSFNIQGKPIVNSLRDALSMLDTTGLDCVVYKQFDKILIWHKN